MSMAINAKNARHRATIAANMIKKQDNFLTGFFGASGYLSSLIKIIKGCH